MPLTHLNPKSLHRNPKSLHRNPAFSQGVLIEGSGALLVVGGQNGVDAHGNLVSTEVGPQVEQALRNLLAVLDEAGATRQDVAKLTIYLHVDADFLKAYAASQRT